ncbi:MAG TPA: YggS family pyridoxal phosphate-dependent enzyme [Jatrophihabitans sp.]|jgi:pyridoxal phosphate enzyme (YggS family)|nr:YggS family pyridoxal phosphate-dependent enzyme [Jatrophihabitans sp.]
MTRLDEHRRAELVTTLGAVRARIADACVAAGRDPHSVALVAVTKTFPASDVAILVRLGVTDIGENRDQEAAAKVVETAALVGDVPAPRWHFVGRLQSRKCRSVASYASAVHSVDRVELVGRLADGVAAAGRDGLEIFVQVSMDDDPDRGGALPDRVPEIAAAVAARPELRLRGVMAIPPLDSDPDREFARLAEVSRALRAEYPEADAISAGMTQDLEAAVRHGSTHVRVGTALLGRREPVFG